jgi:hypothetical protein
VGAWPSARASRAVESTIDRPELLSLEAGRTVTSPRIMQAAFVYPHGVVAATATAVQVRPDSP